MEIFLLFMLGAFIGFLLTILITMAKISDLEDQKYNAELRAVTHFIKLFRIEQIIRKGEENHEFITETMKKIKEAINDRKSTNNF